LQNGSAPYDGKFKLQTTTSFKKEEMYGQSSKSMKSQQHLVNIPQNAGSNENYIHCSVNT
jgi:hypothetical protein